MKKLFGNDLLGRFSYKSRRPRVSLALPVINNLFFFSLGIRHIHEKTRLFTFYANFWRVCWTSLQSDQNLRGPHVAQQQQLSIDICCKLTQQTRRPPPLLSIDGTDRQTDGRTLDRYMTFTAYYTNRVISLKINRFCVSWTSIYPQQSVARCAPTAKISGMFCCMPSNISVATLVGAKSEMPVRAIQDNYTACQKRAPFHILNNSIKN